MQPPAWSKSSHCGHLPVLGFLFPFPGGAGRWQRKQLTSGATQNVSSRRGVHCFGERRHAPPSLPGTPSGQRPLLTSVPGSPGGHGEAAAPPLPPVLMLHSARHPRPWCVRPRPVLGGEERVVTSEGKRELSASCGSPAPRGRHRTPTLLRKPEISPFSSCSLVLDPPPAGPQHRYPPSPRGSPFLHPQRWFHPGIHPPPLPGWMW